METDKIKNIKMSLMESVGEMDTSTNITDYVIKASAKITMNDLVEQTIEEHGIESVLTYIYKDLLKENKDKVDSIGMWINYDGKEYENSIQLQTLNDMERLSEAAISPIFEFFKLMSPAERPED